MERIAVFPRTVLYSPTTVTSASTYSATICIQVGDVYKDMANILISVLA